MSNNNSSSLVPTTSTIQYMYGNRNHPRHDDMGDFHDRRVRQDDEMSAVSSTDSIVDIGTTSSSPPASNTVGVISSTASQPPSSSSSSSSKKERKQKVYYLPRMHFFWTVTNIILKTAFPARHLTSEPYEPNKITDVKESLMDDEANSWLPY